MRKFKEIVTSFTDPESVGLTRVKREEREPMDYGRFAEMLKFIVQMSSIIAFTMIVLYADGWKLALIMLAVFSYIVIKSIGE